MIYRHSEHLVVEPVQVLLPLNCRKAFTRSPDINPGIRKVEFLQNCGINITCLCEQAVMGDLADVFALSVIDA